MLGQGIGIEEPKPTPQPEPIKWLSDEEMIEAVQLGDILYEDRLTKDAAIQQLLSQREVLRSTLVESMKMLGLWMRRARLGEQLLKNLVGGGNVR